MAPRTLLTSVTGLLVVALGIYIFSVSYTGQEGAQLSENSPLNSNVNIYTGEPFIAGGTFNFAPGNLRFSIAPQWIVATDTIPLPKGIDGYKFALVRPGTSCVFAYTRMSDVARGMYRQTSFADRVFSGPKLENQFDSSWYILSSSTPPGFEFQWKGKQPFLNEVRIMPQSTIGRYSYGRVFAAFLLYTLDGSVVPDVCNREVNLMLSTMVESYENAVLDSSASGKLFYEHGKMLLEKDDIVRWVPFPHVAKMIVRDPTLFYTAYRPSTGPYGIENTIKKRDLLNGTDELVLQTKLETDSVNDFYIHKNHLYTLQGPFCDGRCDGRKLFDTDMDNGNTSFLGDVSANGIAGFSDSENALYMANYWGDGGCFSVAYSIYSVIEGVERKSENFGGCEGDPDSEDNAKKSEAFKARFTPLSKANYLLLGGGVVTPKDEDFSDSSDVPFYVVSSE